MKNRKTKTFIYKGLGIPVKLINAPMKKILGKWAIDINFNKLQLAVLYELLYKITPLNGDELKYIRKFFEMSTTEFGKIFGVSHVSILKWESEQTHPPLSTDIYIRLYALNSLHARDKEFRSLYNTINIESFSKHKGEKTRLLSIDIDEDLKIAG